MIFKQTHDGVQIIASDMLGASGGKVESLTLTIRAGAGPCTIIDASGRPVGHIAVATTAVEAKASKPATNRRSVAFPTYPCVHRGEAIGETTCKACGGRRVALKIFKCEKHGECTVDRLGDKIGTPACKVCNDRKAPDV